MMRLYGLWNPVFKYAWHGCRSRKWCVLFHATVICHVYKRHGR